MRFPEHEDIDITSTTIAKTDQINASEMDEEGAVFTIVAVSRGKSKEQPVDIHLEESPGKCWRPCLTMRRLLRDTWGRRTGEWRGRLVHLYCDPEVTYGPKATGGIRLRAASHIDATVERTYQVRRGKYETFTVHKLEMRPTADLDGVLAQHDIPEDQLNAWLESRGKGAPVPPEHRAECAAWLVRDGLLDEIKAFVGAA